jgi:hypothetical protein
MHQVERLSAPSEKRYPIAWRGPPPQLNSRVRLNQRSLCVDLLQFGLHCSPPVRACGSPRERYIFLPLTGVWTAGDAFTRVSSSARQLWDLPFR